MGLIPKEITKKEINLSNKVVGIYGRAGVGKSTLASCFDGVLFAATEAGLSHMDVAKVNITSYETFLELCKEFATTDHGYKTLCIDTYDNLVKLCSEKVCKDLGIDEIGGYKKFGAYHIVTAELHRILNKMSHLPYGLILVSHYTEEEMNSKTKSWKRATISIGGKNKGIMLDICDPLLFMDSKMKGDEEVGVIRTKPSIYWEAKDKGKGLPEEIEYNLADPEGSFKIIHEAYGKGEE